MHTTKTIFHRAGQACFLLY